MVCYIIPATAAIVHWFWRRSAGWDERHKQLSLLLAGAATFGIIDHAWNKELFFSGDIALDLLLGMTITLGIFIVWGALTLCTTRVESTASCEVRKRQR